MHVLRKPLVQKVPTGVDCDCYHDQHPERWLQKDRARPTTYGVPAGADRYGSNGRMSWRSTTRSKHPQGNPERSHCADDAERPAPTAANCNWSDDHGGDQRTDRRATVKDPACQAAIRGGEHTGDDPCGTGPVKGFADAQQGACKQQLAHTGDESRSSSRKAPDSK